MNPYIDIKEENDIKYLDDLATDITHYVSQLILNVYNGVAENVGVPDPDKLAVQPPRKLKKATSPDIRIYCDMDGVLTDCEGHFYAHTRVRMREYELEFGEDAMWERVNKIGHFWLDMPWTPEGKKLWGHIKDYNPILLTAPAKGVDDCRQDKIEWARRELGPDVKVIFSHNKYRYADGKSILIDDFNSNIKNWQMADGIGIRHNSAAETISMLEEKLNDMVTVSNHSGTVPNDSGMILKGFLSGLKDVAKKIIRFVGRRRKMEPFKIKDMVLYKRGKPLTQAQWDRFEKRVIDYLKPYLLDINEEMAVKGVLLAMVSAEAEEQQKQVKEYGKKSLEQVENEQFRGYIPDDIRTARERLKIGRDTEKSMVMAYDRAAAYVQKVSDDVRTAIKQQVINAHRLGKTPQQLASDLYWMKDEVPEMKQYTAQHLLRDWHRVAVTELQHIHNMGKFGKTEHQARESLEKPELAVYFVFSRGTCEWCRAHHGTIVRQIPMDAVGSEVDDSLSSRGIRDPYTDIAVWQGKNNVGYRKASWRVCVPAHPWNTANLVRIHPDAQEYDKRTHQIKFKDEQGLEKYLPEGFRGDLEAARKRNLERKERAVADTREGVHKKWSKYFDEKGELKGTDEKGRPLAEREGRVYVGVPQEEVGKELEAWRADSSRPIPIGTGQKNYTRLFGG